MGGAWQAVGYSRVEIWARYGIPKTPPHWDADVLHWYGDTMIPPDIPLLLLLLPTATAVIWSWDHWTIQRNSMQVMLNWFWSNSQPLDRNLLLVGLPSSIASLRPINCHNVYRNKLNQAIGNCLQTIRRAGAILRASGHWHCREQSDIRVQRRRVPWANHLNWHQLEKLLQKIQFHKHHPYKSQKSQKKIPKIPDIRVQRRRVPWANHLNWDQLEKLLQKIQSHKQPPIFALR